MNRFTKSLFLFMFFSIFQAQCAILNKLGQSRFLHNFSSRLNTEAFSDIHQSSVDIETVAPLTENSDLDSPLKGSPSLKVVGLAGVVSLPVLLPLAGLFAYGFISYEDAKYTKNPTLLEKIAEDHSGIPYAAIKIQNNFYDFSLLKKYDLLEYLIKRDSSTSDKYQYKVKKGKFSEIVVKVPCVFRYRFNGRIIDVVWDIHNSQDARDLNSLLFKEETYSTGLLESVVTSRKSLCFSGLFKDDVSAKSVKKHETCPLNEYQGVLHEAALLNSQHAKIVPLEHSTSVGAIFAYIRQAFPIFPSTPQPLVSLVNYFPSLGDKDPKQLAHLNYLASAEVYSREEKMVKNILDEAKDENKTGSVYASMGAEHGQNTIHILSEYLGEPEYLSLDSFKSKELSNVFKDGWML